MVESLHWMHADTKPDSTMQPFSKAPTGFTSEDAACERCGSFEGREIAGQTLCTDCIELAGCGCASHGGGGE
jgi:hypothetical protein